MAIASSGSRYNVSSYTYPSDVGYSPDLQHYVQFRILQRSSSQFKNSELGGGSVPGATAPAVGGASLNDQERQNIVNNLSGSADVAAAAFAAKALLTGDGSSVLLAGGSKLLGDQVQKAQTGQGFLKNVAALDTKQQSTNVITLHLQEPPSVRYNINYSDVELGAVGGFLTKTAGVKEVLENTNNLTGEALERLLVAIPSAIAGGGGFASNLIGVVARKKANPFREVLFESIDYRTFSFRFRFMPKHDGESQAAKQIIDLFKFHMHPELSANKFFYIYPSEFLISYFYGGAENPYMNKIANCALVDMTVEYGGDKFATFRGGAPVETILTLTFRELVLHTKESVQNGY